MNSPETYCYVSQAPDGDVAVMIDCATFGDGAPTTLRIGSALELIQTDGVKVRAPEPDAWTLEAIRQAPRIVVMNVRGTGGPQETYALTDNVTLQRDEE